jgi:hypothetical protein
LHRELLSVYRLHFGRLKMPGVSFGVSSFRLILSPGLQLEDGFELM